MDLIPMPSDLPDPEFNPNAEIVLRKRYLRKGEDGEPMEDPKQLFWRIAASIAGEEEKYKNSTCKSEDLARRFYSLMTEYKFLPNSPTIMNAGTDLGQLAACFVLPVGDSMEEIFEAIKDAALIHKSGGGTGFSFSRLRPQDSRVGSTGGIASGPLSFLRIFNTATEQVKQGGTRRGANMGILRVDHPDILDFIKAKERDGDLNNFNLSVALTEKFMQAVEHNEDYPLLAPHTGKEKDRLNAREVFALLVRKAWESGDPGIVFLDRINRDNPTPKQGEIESTNPCVTGDTFVCTAHGPRRVADLIGRKFTAIVNGRPFSSAAEGFFSTGRKSVYSLTTEEGFRLRLTGDHPVYRAASVKRKTVQKEWVRAEELTPGDRIVLNDHRDFSGWEGKYGANEGYLLGLLVGDGVLKEDKAVISCWPRAEAANGDGLPQSGIMHSALKCAHGLAHRRDFAGWQKVEGRGEYRLSLGSIKSVCLDLDMSPGNKCITPELEECSSDFCASFLSGLFDADGSVQGSFAKGHSIRLAQSDEDSLLAAQRMLLRLGIKSVIYQNRRPEGETSLPDGKGGRRNYPVRTQHELVISKSNMEVFARRIGFRDEDKNSRLQQVLKGYTRGVYPERFLATVHCLKPEGEEEVFDVRIPGANCFDANGLVVHNCGEQPLLPYEACNLGSINLARFYSPSAGDVDYQELKKAIHLSVRFLDNVIDASRYPLEEITETVHKNRKIGLGIMGWADLLYQMRIPYDSYEALSLGENLMDFFQKESWSASKVLAGERGPFPAYPDSVFAEQNFGPYRNATTTTIAPTGTLSIIAGCSSGVEPLFALSFTRQVMDGEKLLEVNPYFEKALKEDQSYSPKLMEDVARKGTVRDMDFLDPEIRNVFVTSMDIEPEVHLKMQAAFQKYTDNAVSKTVNLPNSATQEDIWRIYWMAYENGCKGVTVYRDGCKSAQVLSTGEGVERDEEKARDASRRVRERPEIVFGFTQKVSTGLGELYLTVNEVDNRPFEVFATIGRSGRSITAKAEAIGRLVSLALRSGIDVREVVTQLKGIGGEHPVFQKKGLLLSIPDAVAWVLENRYLDGEGVKADFSALDRPGCPECGEELIFQEGCFVCQACGYTKCG